MGIKTTAFGGMSASEHTAVAHTNAMIAADAAIDLTKLANGELPIGIIAKRMKAGIEASRPAGANAGDIYWATDTKKIWAYDGAAWQDCKPKVLGPKDLTVAGFRTNAGTGTAITPAQFNDNNTLISRFWKIKEAGWAILPANSYNVTFWSLFVMIRIPYGTSAIAIRTDAVRLMISAPSGKPINNTPIKNTTLLRRGKIRVLIKAMA